VGVFTRLEDREQDHLLELTEEAGSAWGALH
jgi:hypothetical protein